MKKTLLFLLCACFTMNVTLQGMYMYADGADAEAMERFCEASPSACYTVLGIPLLSYAVLVGVILKHYWPTISSCCRSKKQLKEDQLVNHLQTQVDPDLAPGKRRKQIGMALLEQQLPKSSKKDRKASGALLHEHQWDRTAALATAQRRKNTKLIKLLRNLE